MHEQPRMLQRTSVPTYATAPTVARGAPSAWSSTVGASAEVIGAVGLQADRRPPPLEVSCNRHVGRVTRSSLLLEFGLDCRLVVRWPPVLRASGDLLFLCGGREHGACERVADHPRSGDDDGPSADRTLCVRLSLVRSRAPQSPPRVPISSAWPECPRPERRTPGGAAGGQHDTVIGRAAASAGIETIPAGLLDATGARRARLVPDISPVPPPVTSCR